MNLTTRCPECGHTFIPVAQVLAAGPARRRGGRPADDVGTRQAKRQEILDQILPIAERLWLELGGSGPSLELVAERSERSLRGLERALARAALRWGGIGGVKDLARLQAYPRGVSGRFSVVETGV